MENDNKLDIFSLVGNCVTLLILRMDRVFVGVKVASLNHGHINLSLGVSINCLAWGPRTSPSLPQMYTPYNELDAIGLSYQTSTLPMASKQSTHFETFMHTYTIFSFSYLDLF